MPQLHPGTKHILAPRLLFRVKKVSHSRCRQFNGRFRRSIWPVYLAAIQFRDSLRPAIQFRCMHGRRAAVGGQFCGAIMVRVLVFVMPTAWALRPSCLRRVVVPSSASTADEKPQENCGYGGYDDAANGPARYCADVRTRSAALSCCRCRCRCCG